MSKAKLLHVIAGMDPQLGGVCQAVRTIIKGLSSFDIHNEVVSLDAPNEPFLLNDQFKVHALGPSKGPWGYSKTLLPWLLNNLENFDYVIVHGLWLYPSHCVEKALRRLKKSGVKRAPKLLIMPHGMLDPYFQRAPERRLKAVRNWLYWKLVEGKVVNRSDALLFTCQDELQLAREPFSPYTPFNEIVVGLGVENPPNYDFNMKHAFELRCEHVNGKPFLLFLSRIHEKKGVDILVKAYNKVLKDVISGVTDAALMEKVIDVFPRLVIAGPGIETTYGVKIRKLIDDFELKEWVFFPGMLTGDAKWGAFYGCDAFVLPSHQENFGIAVVEALACSKPVLISNQVNIWREIESERAGMVEEDTVKGVLKLLQKWITLSSDEKAALSTNAKKSFNTYFALQPASQNFIEKIAMI